MKAPPRFLLPPAARLLAMALALAAMGCAAPYYGETSPSPSSPRIGILKGVILGDRPASGPDIQLVQILHYDRPTETYFGMALRKGDRIITRGASAVITFEGGWEVVLEPESELEILNPSIFVRIGAAIVKKLREIRETLEAQTEYTIAAPEGTLFKIEVRKDTATYKVVEGQLRVSSRYGAWPPVVLGAFDQGTVFGNAPPQLDRLNPGEARKISWEAQWMLDLLKRPPSPPEPEPPVYDSKYYCAKAMAAARNNDEKTAAALAQKALDLYKRDRDLSRSEYADCRKLAAGPAEDDNRSDAPPYSQDSTDYCAKAVEAARRGDTKGAASLAQKALDLNEKDRRLTKTQYADCRKLAAGPAEGRGTKDDRPDTRDSRFYCAQALEAAKRGDPKAASLAQKALDLNRQDRQLSKAEYDACSRLAGPE